MTAGRNARIAVAACMTLMSLGLLELGVRMVGRTDPDGNFSVGRREVLPLHLPIHGLEASVRQYRASGQALFRDDPTLGWTPRPRAQNELYAYNADGLRARRPDDAVGDRRAGTLRIAIFGDSFAHGSEVTFDQSWGSRLQQALDRADRPVQVLNFGVPGYGMDQAFLRWEAEGRHFAPDVVVFGVQVENAGRNLNLLRVLYDSADLPFAKPRFVESGDRLEVVNVPVPGPEEVVRIVRSIDEWPLLRHERYYQRDRYEQRPWRHSRLIGMVEGLVAGRRRAQLEGELPEEQRRLAVRIVDRFASSVRDTGARFMMVHFPRRTDLEQARANGRLPNLDLLETLNSLAPVVRVDRALLDRIGDGDLAPLFMPGGHYSPDGYALLAAAVAARLPSELAAVAQNRDRAGARTH